MTWYGDEQIKTLQDVHLLKPAGVDEGINLALTTTIQQLQTILCAHQQVHTWGHTYAQINNFFIEKKIIVITAFPVATAKNITCSVSVL